MSEKSVDDVRFVRIFTNVEPKKWKDNFFKENGDGPFRVLEVLSTQLRILLPNGKSKLIPESYCYYEKVGVAV